MANQLVCETFATCPERCQEVRWKDEKGEERPAIFCFWNTRNHGCGKLVIVQPVISADSSHFSHPAASTTIEDGDWMPK